MSAIVLHDVGVAHAGRPALAGLSGCFATGSLTAVIGPNGAGKTTLLRTLAGLQRHTGQIDGLGRVALLPQSGAIDRSFPLASLEVVALGAARVTGPFRAIDVAPARQALERVNLAEVATRPVAELSAGQFQRVLFARLMVEDAPVLLLDEPFNGVDAPTQERLLALVLAWSKEGRTVIVALHDLDLVRAVFPQTLRLAGRAEAWGPTADVLPRV